MKFIAKTLSLVLFASMLFFTSCREKEDNPDPTPNQEDFSENFGNSVNRDFMGKIMDANHNPISGVNIAIGSETTTTDGNGYFILEDVTVYERFAHIKATKSGYLRGSRTVVPSDGMNQITLMLLDENIVGTVPSGSDSEVNLPNGAKVSFDGAFKDENGNDYSGNVTVMMQHLDPSDPDIALKMPGSLYAQNQNNNERILETYGMLNVELRGSGGEKLNIADGHTATIELPADSAQTNAPNTIPLWHFDEEKGYWIEDGTADLIGGKYIGQVSHFSWWNCDAQFPTITLCMTIEDANNNPVYGVKVELWRSGAVYPRIGWSNGNGEICGLVPANETLTMKVYDSCGNLVSTSSIGPFSSDTNLGVVQVPALPTVTITGTMLDCNNDPVTDGYIIMKSGSYINGDYQEIGYTVTNGTFTFTTLACNTVNNFTLEGIDNTGFQTTGILNYTFTAPNTNVGNVIACNAITEFITYQIDNDPAITYIFNIQANYYSGGNSYGISANSSDQSDWFYMSINANPGQYNYGTDLSMELSSANLDYNQPVNITGVVSTNPIANIGDYIDVTFFGTYTDTSGVVRSINGVAHVIRDN